MATIVKVDGTRIELIGTNGPNKLLTLDQIQKAVGGMFEVVRRGPGIEKGMALLVNENGIAEELPVHPYASHVAGQTILGDVVWVKLVMGEDGEDLA